VPHKLLQIIVFFPTARAAQFHAGLARASGCPCFDLHSRLSQSKRDQAAAAFGSQPTGVMFASDVIARGLDFPDVSLVVQVGGAGWSGDGGHLVLGGVKCSWVARVLWGSSTVVANGGGGGVPGVALVLQIFE
jgi:hypothetical protein